MSLKHFCTAITKITNLKTSFKISNISKSLYILTRVSTKAVSYSEVQWTQQITTKNSALFHTVYLYVPCQFHHEQRLFRYTQSACWF